MGQMTYCRRCGKLIVDTGIGVCKDCVAREDEDYSAVKRYLIGHPNADLSEISDATGVPVPVIVHFVKRGLLMASDHSKEVPSCRVCGKPAESGTLCSRCHRAFMSAAPWDGLADDRRRTAGDSNRDENLKEGGAQRMYTMDRIARQRPRR